MELLTTVPVDRICPAIFLFTLKKVVFYWHYTYEELVNNVIACHKPPHPTKPALRYRPNLGVSLISR